jgi:glycine hydroxymethyltransferase
MIYESLEIVDPEINEIIKKEEERQRTSLELIASENFASVSVLQVGSSVLANKYSEGEVGKRYYGGNEYIDELEIVCKKRALELYNLDPETWDVNVQPLSGSNANMAVYLGLIGKNGKLMGLDLPAGGHLTHGYQTPKRKVSATSLFFNSMSYGVKEDGSIDYDDLEEKAGFFKPDIIVSGATAYSLDFDYERLRKIAGEKYLMTDMSHISGFIATGLMKNAFEFADVVTTTTHKILRGPRAAMIYFKKSKIIDGETVDMKTKINSALFPGLNGGPHNQKIGALAVALKQAATPEYKNYCIQVINNAKVMCEELKRLGCVISCDKTECHLFLLSYPGVSGSDMERVCELVSISINKNTMPKDTSPFRPSAIRIGTPAITTRGFTEDNSVDAARFVHRAILIAKTLKESTNDAAEFNEKLISNKDVAVLRNDVVNYMVQFPIPRFDFRCTRK